VPLPGAPTVGFSTAGRKFLSIVRRAWMVSTRDNEVFAGLGLRRVIPLHLVSNCRVPVLGLFVVGVTNWSGEGVRPRSLRRVFGSSANPCDGCPPLPFIDVRGGTIRGKK
jgi:hypothetical protein